MTDQHEAGFAVANSSSVPSLVAGLGELPALMLASDSVDQVVWETAMLAVRASEAVDACGVTLLRDGRPISLLPATASYANLEEHQYVTADGPAVEAIRSARIVPVPSTAADERFPEYSRQATEAGVGSSLSLPLIAGKQVLGAVNFYAERPHAFPERFLLGELVADLASTGLWCLLKHADKQQMSTQLEEALSSRAEIDQAKGILIAQQGCGPDEAFDLLRKVSQNRNVKLRDLAVEIVTNASGRKNT